MNDWELLREYVQTRSQPAFAQLVERHVRWVHAVCARRLRDTHLAEDVTQAVFVLLARKAPRLKPQASLSGWLFRTATLTSSNAMKMQRRRTRRETRAAAAAAAASAAVNGASAQRGAGGASAAHESELITAIDAALARLRPHDREVLVLRFYGNKSVTEVAAELGISIDAAKKRFTRALDALRQALADQGVTVPAVGGTMMILSAVTATTAQALPAGLNAWVSAGASPADVSADAAEIVRWIGQQKVLAAALTSAAVAVVIVLTGALAWSLRPGGGSPAGIATAAATVPLPRVSRTTTAPDAAAAAVRSAAPGDGRRLLSGHTSWITQLAISPDGRHAASRSLNQLLRWDLESGDPLGPATTIREQPLGLAVATGGRTIAVDRTDLLVLDVTGDPRRLPPPAQPGARHWSLAISSDGRRLAAGGSDGVVRLIDLATGAELRALRGHVGVVNVVAFAPDDRTLLTGGFDRSVRSWDAEAGAQLHQFDGHTSSVHAVSFAPDGRSALSFARTMAGPTTRTVADAFVRVWDLNAARLRIALPVSAPAVHAAAFTPDGASVVALVAQELVAWDLSTGNQRVRRRVLPANAAPSCATFSRDARRLLVGGDGKDRNVVTQIELGDPLAGPTTTPTTPTTPTTTPPK